MSEQDEDAFLLGLYERLWPRDRFASEEAWLAYCRKWFPQLHGLVNDFDRKEKDENN